MKKLVMKGLMKCFPLIRHFVPPSPHRGEGLNYLLIT
jgi:hypothetical protein